MHHRLLLPLTKLCQENGIISVAGQCHMPTKTSWDLNKEEQRHWKQAGLNPSRADFLSSSMISCAVCCKRAHQNGSFVWRALGFFEQFQDFLCRLLQACTKRKLCLSGTWMMASFLPLKYAAGMKDAAGMTVSLNLRSLHSWIKTHTDSSSLCQI